MEKIKNFDEFLSISVPILEMATIKKDNFWNGEHFRVAVHGPTKNTLNTPKDRPTPHIHIYLTRDVYPYNLFNFEISLVDIFAKGEYNLLKQKDNQTIHKFKGVKEGLECSWIGYGDILDGLKSLLSTKVNVEKNNVICVDNLQYCIETYNEESNVMTENPFLDYIQEHHKEYLKLDIFRINLKKYYPSIYMDLFGNKKSQK